MPIDSATAARLEPVHDHAVRTLFTEARTASTFNDDPVGVNIDLERLCERVYRGDLPAATALDRRAPGI